MGKMNGIKGLIYKEFLLKRKTLLITMSIWLLLFILAVSVCLSMEFGNLANNQNLTAKSTVIFSYLLAAVAMISFTSRDDTVYSDAKCHWNQFEYTLPVSAEKIAAVKVSLLGASALFALAISLFTSWVISTLSHTPMLFAVIKNITMIMLICMFISVISTVLMFRYKNPQTVLAILFGVAAAVFAVIAVWYLRKMNLIGKQFVEMGGEELMAYTFRILADRYAGIRDAVFPFSALIFAAIILLGYFLFTGQLKRRENEWQVCSTKNLF